MQLQDVMNRNIGPVSPETRLWEAARQMRLSHLPILPVCQNGRLIGLITPRDLTVRATAQGCDPQVTAVQAVMTREIICGLADQDLHDAEALMLRYGLTRLLVVDHTRRLVGIVALADVQRWRVGNN